VATYTWDQIANQLTHGFWNNVPRAFDVSTDRNITVDLSRLSTEARTIAQTALNQWSSATGINFVDVGAAATLRAETTDAAGSTATAYAIGTNTIISGNITSSADVDYYRVTLTAGQTYVISMSGGAGLDSILQLRNSAGTLLVESDDPSSSDAGEYITFTAASSGTYYIAADGYSTTTGSYELSIQTAADITFGDSDPTGAYAYSDISGNTILRSYINIADNWDTLTMNGYMLQTYIHEIGHALGLGHAGNYNGSATYPNDALYDNDSWLASVMSYFSQTQNTFVPGDYAYLATIMPADIIAIQNLYGAGTSGYQTGNTVWGPGGNLNNTLQTMWNMAAGLTPADPLYYQNQPMAGTIYDTAGIDTLDFSAFSNNSEILLSELEYSNIAGLIDNIVIARGTVIENAIGGAGGETIVGNSVDNVLEGRGGVDNISGGDGNDTLIGGSGGDTLNGGANTAFGDTLSYVGSALGVTVNLSNNTATGGDATGDIISNFENVTGSDADDTLTGSGSTNRLIAGAGNDTVNGGSGSDTLDGGTNTTFGDTLSYADSVLGVTVNLNNNTAAGGDAAGDVISNFENVTGSGVGDTLTGSAAANRLTGGAGADTLNGLGGADFLFGGEGNDRIYYDAADLAANVNGGNDTDTLVVVDGSLPVSFNLVAASIEGAEWNRTDTAGQSWSTIKSIYGSNWALQQSTTVYDNGTFINYYEDYDSSKVWISVRDDYNSSSLLTQKVLALDNGTNVYEYYDVNNSQVWSYSRTDYNASLQGTQQVTFLDNGIKAYEYFDVDGTQTWVSSRTDYNADFEITQRVTVLDTGIRVYEGFDPDDLQSWSEYRYNYTNDFQLLDTRLVDDSGSYTTVNYDVAGTQTWNEWHRSYSAAGVLLSEFFV
jgi:hypothetical protein